MIKVGILTFHRSINYGSYLQGYSLAKALKEHTGYDVEIIDYNLRSAELKFLADIVVTKNISQIPKNVIKYSKFRCALRKKMPLSEQRLISDNLAEAERFLDNRYDVIIVGSDEIWKINKLRGFPNIYWLSRKLDCIKISYAASANRTRFDELEQSQKELMKDTLHDFNYIGVRDQNTFDQLTGIDSTLQIKKNCDPTFMFDLEESNRHIPAIRDKFKNKYRLDIHKPVIAIMCTDNRICKAVYEYYRDKYQIVSLYVNTRHCDAYIYDLDPFEWSCVIGSVNLCVTNFFHCTVFSILNNTSFIAFDVEDTSLLYESKIKDLLKRADLLGNYFNVKEAGFRPEKMFQRIDAIKANPDFRKMKEFVVNERKYFFDFVDEMSAITI